MQMATTALAIISLLPTMTLIDKKDANSQTFFSADNNDSDSDNNINCEDKNNNFEKNMSPMVILRFTSMGSPMTPTVNPTQY